MIMDLLAIKEKIKEIYGRYDKFILPCIRFVFALITIILINSNIGYMAKFKNPAVVFLISLMCAFLPSGAIVAFGAIIILGHVVTLSIELGVMVFVVFAVLLCAYFRFSPREGYMVAVTAMLFALKMPYLVPVIAGLTLSVFSFIPVSIGIFVHYLIRFASSYNKSLDEMTTTNIMDNVNYILKGLFDNKGMLVFILVFSVTILIVAIIKKFSIDYAWAIAAGIGIVVNVIMMLVANTALGAGISVAGVILGNLLAAVVGAVLYVMVFSGDYSRTENVQFEDDDYYYYVKAVPKFSVVSRDIKVKKINAKKVKPAASYEYSKEVESEYEETEDADVYEEVEFSEGEEPEITQI